MVSDRRLLNATIGALLRELGSAAGLDHRPCRRPAAGNQSERAGERETGGGVRKLGSTLAGAGAELAAVSSMRGHFCINELQAVSPLPLLNAIPEVDVAIRQQGLKNIGILGTRLVMETGLYGGITSARTMAPDEGALELVHQSCIAMATVGRVTDVQRRIFLLAGEAMARNGAEAILLGGTDLFLAFDAFDCSFPVIDSTEIHLDAIYRRLTE